MHHYTFSKGALVMGVVLLFLFSCKNYYKVNTITHPDRKLSVMDSLSSQNRYFILRVDDAAYRMKNIEISKDRKSLSFKADSVPPFHYKHISSLGKRNYKKDLDERVVINEVHLFIKNGEPIKYGEKNTFPFDDLIRLEILEHDAGRTTGSYVLGAVIGVAATFAVLAIIIAATKSSCPFISGYYGNEMTLQGEIYGGAIYPQLARHDYLPLRLDKNPKGNYEILISNELKEKQYTDLAELWVVHHEKGVRVLPDENGNLYSIGQTVSPVEAKDNNNISKLDFVIAPNDHKIYSFEDTLTSNGVNELLLAFNNTTKAEKARLVIRAKNSYFLDYLYGELAKGLGSYYPRYIKKQEKRPAADLKKWVEDQRIPLEVLLRTKEGWKRKALLTTVGPLEFRDLVVELELDPKDPILEVKLRTGFMFWEVDAVSADFSEPSKFVVEKIKPFLATDEKGTDVINKLMEKDNIFHEQPAIGNWVSIQFRPGADNTSFTSSSFILHAYGYYQHIRDYKGTVDIKFLKQFKKADAFAKYGIKQFRSIQEQEIKNIALTTKY
jgi:hypothetical protein